MNKDYVYVDGKVIVRDEKDNYIEKEYYDNLDKVLVKENLIEIIEEQIEKLTIKDEMSKKNKNKYIPLHMYNALLVTFGLPPLLIWYSTGTNPYMHTIDTFLGTFNEVVFFNIISGILSLPIASSLTFVDYSNFKDIKCEKEAIKTELKYLKLRLEKEKENLDSLQKDKTKIKDNFKFRTIKVDDKNELDKLNKYINLYYELGYNKEKYYNYFINGKLDKKMQKKYSEEEIKLMKDYFNQENSTLIKKKKI